MEIQRSLEINVFKMDAPGTRQAKRCPILLQQMAILKKYETVSWLDTDRKMQKSYDHLFKLAVVGDLNCGKSSILDRYSVIVSSSDHKRFTDDLFQVRRDRTISQYLCDIFKQQRRC